VEIVAFDRKFDRNSFNCGKPDLNDWLRTQAGQQERAGNTRTFMAVEGFKVIGYYATTAYRLGLDEAAAMYGAGRRAYPIPAVLLARLAVDVGSQGGGIGSALLLHALRQIAAASRYVGFEAVVVHAIDRSAVAFYAQRGFTRFEDHDLRLFMPGSGRWTCRGSRPSSQCSEGEALALPGLGSGGLRMCTRRCFRSAAAPRVSDA